MPKKRPAPKKPELIPELIPKLIKWPEDWIEKIDAMRGDVPFSDFVRQAVLDKIGRLALSSMPGWGKGRLKK